MYVTPVTDVCGPNMKEGWPKAGVVDYTNYPKYTHIIRQIKSTTLSLLRRDTPPSKGGESYDLYIFLYL